jgi:hypothetical protein
MLASFGGCSSKAPKHLRMLHRSIALYRGIQNRGGWVRSVDLDSVPHRIISLIFRTLKKGSMRKWLAQKKHKLWGEIQSFIFNARKFLSYCVFSTLPSPPTLILVFSVGNCLIFFLSQLFSYITSVAPMTLPPRSIFVLSSRSMLTTVSGSGIELAA